jgi:transcriptional regulator with XRE-family HTH domain
MKLPQHMPFGDIDHRIGKRLRTLREDKKYDTKEFAELIGVTEACLVQCEFGKQRIAPSLMMRLLSIFGLECQFFYQDTNSPHEANGYANGVRHPSRSSAVNGPAGK